MSAAQITVLCCWALVYYLACILLCAVLSGHLAIVRFCEHLVLCST